MLQGSSLTAPVSLSSSRVSLDDSRVRDHGSPVALEDPRLACLRNSTALLSEEPSWVQKLKEDIRLIIRSELDQKWADSPWQNNSSSPTTTGAFSTSRTRRGSETARISRSQFTVGPVATCLEVPQQQSTISSPRTVQKQSTHSRISKITEDAKNAKEMGLSFEAEADGAGSIFNVGTTLSCRTHTTQASGRTNVSVFGRTRTTGTSFHCNSATGAVVRATNRNTHVGLSQSFQSFWGDAIATRTFPVFEPNGYFMRSWNGFIFMLVIFAVVATPYDIAFPWSKPPSAYKAIGKVIDCLFLLDMVLHFNTGVVHGDHVTRNRKYIACHYAITWLPIDILSNFPFDWVMGSDGKQRKLVKFLKMPKILRFVKLLRLLKSQMHYIGMLAVIMGIFLCAHYSACIWVFVMVAPSCDGEQDNDLCPDPAGTYAEVLATAISAMSGTDSWTRFTDGSSRIAQFRKMEPPSGWEEMLNACISTCGFILLACLFGTVSHAMSSMNRRGQARFSRLQDRKRDMKLAKVPVDLQRRVESTYEYSWMFGDWHDEFLNDVSLSLDLRRNLAYHVFGPAIKNLPIFARMHTQELKCLSQKIRSRCYTPGDLIIQVGERAEEMFLVCSGSARPLDAALHAIGHALLQRGDFFGEICFFLPGTRRTASVVCLEFCRSMVITVSMFEELGYELQLDMIRKDCTARMEELLTKQHEKTILMRCKCQCGNFFLGDARFCIQCGLHRPNSCVCGAILHDNADFCRNCGKMLKPGLAATQPDLPLAPATPTRQNRNICAL